MSPLDELLLYRRMARQKPVSYTKHALGIDLWEAQQDIMTAAADSSIPYISVRSGNGVGKTYLTAALICQYLDTHYPAYAIPSSSSWTQVGKTVWPTLQRVWQNAPAHLGGEMLKTEWQRGPQWGAFCVSPDKPENFSGFRTENGCLIIVDEASALEQLVHEAIMGLASAEGSKVIYLGNPLRPEGPFYGTFQNPDWVNFHISTLDVVDLGIPGLATREWVEARKREWGEDSPAYQARVLGDFPESSSASLIKLGWLSQRIVPKVARPLGTMRMGVDVARFGDDRTVLLVRDDRCVKHVETYSGASTMEAVGRIIAASAEWKVDQENIFIDDCGLGGGVTDRLHEQGIEVTPVNVGERAVERDRFFNLRSELYWKVREAFHPDSKAPVLVPKQYGEVAKECTWVTYELHSNGAIKLTPKQKVKAKHQRSPDLADALALTFFRDAVAFQMEAA